MTLLAFALTALITNANAADAAAPAASVTPNATVAAPTVTTPTAPTATPPTAPIVTLPTGPVAKDKTNSYSTRTQIETCTPETLKKCEISTFVVAKDLVGENLVWERRIYFQHYDLEKPIDAQAITVKALNLVNKKFLAVRNSRGDSFELSVDHGHLKKPKDARAYSK